jgi:hypothetical protein
MGDKKCIQKFDQDILTKGSFGRSTCRSEDNAKMNVGKEWFEGITVLS